MAMRHVDPQEELWRASVRSFCAAVQAGLPALNMALHSQSAASAAAAAATTSAYSLSSLTGFGGGGSALSSPTSPAGSPGNSTAVPVPYDTWPCLARAFEMSLLGRNLPGPLPAGVLPNPPLMPSPVAAVTAAPATPGGPAGSICAGSAGGAATPTSGGSSAAVTGGPGAGGPSRASVDVSGSLPAVGTTAGGAGGAAAGTGGTGGGDFDVQVLVLDCLSDTVLCACQYAPQEVRGALVGLLDAGAAEPMAGEAQAPATQRFSHACLSRLNVLCSRGHEAGSGARPGSNSSAPQSARPSVDGGVGGAGLGGLFGGGAGAAAAAAGASVDQSSRCQLEVAQLALPCFLGR